MDDFRRRYDVPRRNYGGMPPTGQPGQAPQQPAQPQHVPAPHQPQHHQTHQPAPVHHTQPPHQPQQHHSQPANSELVQPPIHHQQQPAHHQGYHQTHQPAAEPIHHRPVPVAEPVKAKKVRRKPNLKVVGIIAGAVIFLAVAGYFAFKPSKPKVIMPEDLAKQASFKFYYPSPMPAGYSYNTSQGTFQNGSAYYMLMNGGKHIVVTETSSVGNNSLGKLADSTQFKAPIGNVVLGTEINQTSAYVLAGDTLISIHSYGRIPKDEMTNVINSFKQLGQPAS